MDSSTLTGTQTPQIFLLWVIFLLLKYCQVSVCTADHFWSSGSERFEHTNGTTHSCHTYLKHLTVVTLIWNITSDVRCTTEIESRIDQVKAIFQMKNISRSIEYHKRVIKCYIETVLLYDSDSCIVNEQIKKNFETMEMWISYKFCGYTERPV